MKKRAVIIGMLLITCAISLSGCSFSQSVDNFANGMAKFAKKHTKTVPGPKIKKTFNVGSYHNLKINTEASDLEVKTGKAYQVIYHGKKKVTPTVKVQNGTLQIKQQMPNGYGNITDDQTITIVIPKEKLASLSIDSESGDVDLDDLNVHTLKVDTESGDFDAGKLVTNWGKVDTESGDVDIDALKSKTGFGIDSESGDVTIKNVNASGYDLDAESGDLTVNGKDHDDDYTRHTHTSNVLKVDSESGDIEIN